MVTTSLRGAIFLRALIFVSAAGALVSAFGQSPSPSGADIGWVDEHLVAARDSLLPMRGLEHREFIAYRGSREPFTDTSHFTITFADGRMPPEATVTTLTGGSVRDQLLKLHLADRDAPLAILLLGAGVRRTKLTPDRCPALQSRIDELMKVAIVMPRPKNFIALHPVLHEIVMSLRGTHLDAIFDDSQTGLVSWALETLNALKTCTAA